MTRKGIEYDLKKSEYKIVKCGLIFYFSSRLYLDKFMNTVDEYVNNQVKFLESKYKIHNVFEVYLMISYYKKIEKRGFVIYDTINKKDLTEDVIFINNILSY